MSDAPPPSWLSDVVWLRRLVVSLAALNLVLIGTVVALYPQASAYDALFSENLQLKRRLQQIDRSMAEVDRVLLRLRLYDAQIKSLADGNGEHGPLPEDAIAPEQFANHRILSVFEQTGDETVGDVLNGEDLRPAEAWAMAVEARAETFLSLFAMAEPDLNAIMTELEDLKALESALPSTWPATGPLTSGFGWRRHPLARTNWKFHSGLDISAKRNAPIVAAAPGRVTLARFNSGYGNMVEIDHGFGITTTYAHCTTLMVEEGAVVEEGDQIATVGATGRVTGPHLHFEVRLDGHAVDPLDYLPR